MKKRCSPNRLLKLIFKIRSSISLFISFFIGDNIIISGINQEKRIDEKTEEEIHRERGLIEKIQKDIEEIKKSIQLNNH